MTRLLSKAFSKVQELPEEEQDALASLLLAEIESERNWSEAFQKSEHQLTLLAQEALSEYKAGRTEPDEES